MQELSHALRVGKAGGGLIRICSSLNGWGNGIQTVLVTNSDFDPVLLVNDNDQVRSSWQADARMIKAHLAFGARAKLTYRCMADRVRPE